MNASIGFDWRLYPYDIEQSRAHATMLASVGIITEADLIPDVRAAIVEGMKGPLARDVPYTHETDGVLRRLAALAPTTLAIMHGSSYRGDGKKLLLDFACVLRETIGPR